jgi:hypothetical protein
MAGQQADGVQGVGHVGPHDTQALFGHLLEVRLGPEALKMLDDPKHHGRCRDAEGGNHSQMECAPRPWRCMHGCTVLIGTSVLVLHPHLASLQKVRFPCRAMPQSRSNIEFKIGCSSELRFSAQPCRSWYRRKTFHFWEAGLPAELWLVAWPRISSLFRSEPGSREFGG